MNFYVGLFSTIPLALLYLRLRYSRLKEERLTRLLPSVEDPKWKRRWDGWRNGRYYYGERLTISLQGDYIGRIVFDDTDIGSAPRYARALVKVQERREKEELERKINELPSLISIDDD